MVTRWAVVLLAGGALLLSSGCKKDEDPSGPGPVASPPPPELVGTWVFQSGTLGGNPVELSDVMEWVGGATSAEFTVGADGTYSYREKDQAGAVLFQSAGTFVVTGANATITITSENGQPISPAEVLSGTWALSGDGTQLTLTYNLITQNLVLIAQKS
jgi:hypothetical protein